MEEHSRKGLMAFAIIVVIGAIVAVVYYYSVIGDKPAQTATPEQIQQALDSLQSKTASQQTPSPLTNEQKRAIKSLETSKTSTKSQNTPETEKSILESLQ